MTCKRDPTVLSPSEIIGGTGMNEEKRKRQILVSTPYINDVISVVTLLLLTFQKTVDNVDLSENLKQKQCFVQKWQHFILFICFLY